MCTSLGTAPGKVHIHRLGEVSLWLVSSGRPRAFWLADTSAGAPGHQAPRHGARHALRQLSANRQPGAVPDEDC